MLVRLVSATDRWSPGDRTQPGRRRSHAAYDIAMTFPSVDLTCYPIGAPRTGALSRIASNL